MAARPLQDHMLCFIGGGGRVGTAMIAGLLKQGQIKTDHVVVSTPSDATRARVEAELHVRAVASNAEAVRDSDIVILAVKPHIARSVCQELAVPLSRCQGPGNKAPLVISVMAAITTQSLRSWLSPPRNDDGRSDGGSSPRIVRVMPNTPALVGEGASGAYAGPDVTKTERELVSALLAGFNRATEWVDTEDLIGVVMGVSGSGPAYFFVIVEHLIASATSLGLPREQAERLAKQTCLGAGKMLVESVSESAAQLRDNVTSPGGPTQAALRCFDEAAFPAVVDRAVKACINRAKEMERKMG